MKVIGVAMAVGLAACGGGDKLSDSESLMGTVQITGSAMVTCTAAATYMLNKVSN
jgi:hypothetical protein